MATTDGPTPEVAVVVPCYGHAHLLPEAVASIAAQTWPVIHCLIVDDGSPDDTHRVAGELMRQFPDRRIELVRQANGGLAAARNKGIRASSAPYILPLDADDMLQPEAVERMVTVLRQDPTLSVVTPLGRTFGDADQPLVTLPATPARLRRGNCLVYSSMFTRSAYAMAGGYDETMRPQGYEDWDLWLRLVERGARFAHLPEELFRYRKHGPTMLAEADAAAPLLRARVALNHPRLFSGWRRRLAARLLAQPDRPSRWVRLGVLLTLLIDGRRRLAVRQLRSLLHA